MRLRQNDLWQYLSSIKAFQIIRSKSAAGALVFAATTTYLIWDLFQFHSGNRDNFSVVGGIFPISDARNYLQNAVRLLYSGDIDTWGARRPLASLLLAAIVSLSGISIATTQVFFATLGASSVAITYVAARQSLSQVAALLSALLVLIFFLLHAQATLLSEHFGLWFGSLALLYGVSGIKKLDFSTCLTAIFFLGLALAIRPGPMIALPALATTIWLIFRQHSNGSWYRMALIIVAAALPFLTSTYLTSALCNQPQIPFANAASTVYGITNGGTGWHSAYVNNPAVAAMSEEERAQNLIKQSWKLFKEQPWLTVRGILKYYQMGIIEGSAWGFSRSALLNFIFFVGLLSTLLLAPIYRPTLPLRCICIAVIGALLSVPVSIDGGPRVFAAIFPMMAVAALGWTSYVRNRVDNKTNSGIGATHTAIAAIILSLLAMKVFANIGPEHTEERAPLARLSRPDNGSSLVQAPIDALLISSTEKIKTCENASCISNQGWTQSLQYNYQERDLKLKLLSLKEGAIVTTMFDLKNLRLYWLVLENSSGLTDSAFNSRSDLVSCDESTTVCSVVLN